jgi:hypothetical protein
MPSHSSDFDRDLPFIDEHHVVVAAPPAVVWRCLGAQFGRTRPPGSGLLTQILGAEPRRTAGTLLDEGATVPGFAVIDSVPEQRVRLAGRHRFSAYVLVFSLAAVPGGTRLTAGTYARFPGLRGAVYRGLVIGSGAHRAVVARLLRGVRHQAQAADTH